MRARQVLLISLLAAAISVPLVLRSAEGPGRQAVQEVSYGRWADGFVACAGGVMTDAVLATDAAQECLLAVMLDAVDAGAIWEMQEQLELQIAETPALFSACHDIGHEAGRRAYERDPDIGRLIAENMSVTCAYGLGHGVLDGFAAALPGPDGFRAAAEACALKDGMAAGLCADGIGHSAWSATEDLPLAVSYCEMLPPGGARAACAEGIIMQIYEPAGFDAAATLEQAFAELPEVCAGWPSDDPETRSGCSTGAGYIYTRNAWKLEVAVRNREPSAAAAQEGIVREVARAGDLCRRHHDEKAVLDCLGSVAIQVPHSLYENEMLLEAACSGLGDRATLCLSWQHVVS